MILLESEKLRGPTAKNVVPSRDLRNCDAVLTMGSNELVNSPLAIAVTLREDLGPVITRGGSHPNLDGSFMGDSNNIVIAALHRT